MTIEQFLALQSQLMNAFGPAIKWWLILFLVAGVGLAILLFALVMGRSWLDRS